MDKIFLLLLIFVVSCLDNQNPISKQSLVYHQRKQKPKKISEIPLPEGYKRIPCDSGSFGFFLRELPLSENDTLYYYDSTPVEIQSFHYAVIKMDIGNQDLQQCADAIMRLRAEYFYSKKQYSKIKFSFVSDGKPRYYIDYAKNDFSYPKFRKYLNWVFTYANTTSLKNDMKPTSLAKMKIGDVFIQTGHRLGHAVIIVDMAYNPQTNDTIFLLAQSFMPAQNIHILKNLNNPKLSPWYSKNFGYALILPQWTFYAEDLRTWY